MEITITGVPVFCCTQINCVSSIVNLFGSDRMSKNGKRSRVQNVVVVIGAITTDGWLAVTTRNRGGW